MGKHQSFVFSLQVASGQEKGVQAHRMNAGPQVYSLAGAALSTTNGQLTTKQQSGIRPAHSMVSICIPM